MNLAERNVKIRQFFDEGLQILEKKGADYNPNGVAFDEIKSEASALNLAPETYMCVLMSKHWGAIKRYSSTSKLESEPIRERLKDMANYCAMMAVMIEDGQVSN